jgi:hypothetical protein
VSRFDGRIFEHGFVDEVGIFRKVEVGTDEDSREVEGVAEECEEAWVVGDAFGELPFV